MVDATMDCMTAPAPHTTPEPTTATSHQRARFGLSEMDPRLAAIGGAVMTALSAILIKLADTTAATAAVFRCLLALPVMVPLAVRETRRLGRRPAKQVAFDLAAGAFLAVDLTFWAQSIDRIGAGLATVLLNFQVVVVPLLTFLLFRERMSARLFAIIPLALAGVALAAGVVGENPFGDDPVTGAIFGVIAGTAYAAYLVLLRAGAAKGYRASPVCNSSISCLVVAGVFGITWTGLDLTPSLSQLGWLTALAVTGPVLGWLLLAAALPRLSAGVGSALLLLQPVVTMVLGVVLLAERPTGWQLAGGVLVLATVWLASRKPKQPAAASDVLEADGAR